MIVISHTAARELGAGLRTLRIAAGLTTRSLADAIGTSSANISNWENARRLLTESRLVALLDVLNPATEERERLLGLRRQAEGPGELVAGTNIGPRLARLIEQEHMARHITDVAPLLIPGLLQTRGYAKAILGNHPDVETLVALRMGRRDILDGREPVRLHALIDDEVLVRPIAPPPVIADQLRHLLAMAERPNITIQLVPSTGPHYSPHLAGPFILFQFASASPVVHLEHHSASVTLWDEAEVHRFMEAVEVVRERAMTAERSTELIAKMVDGMEI